MKVRALNLSMTGVVSRFYMMMFSAILLGFMGVNWVLISFITVAFAFSTILGLSFELPKEEKTSARASNMSTIKGNKKVLRAG